jgi:hypothetical protein
VERPSIAVSAVIRQEYDNRNEKLTYTGGVDEKVGPDRVDRVYIKERSSWKQESHHIQWPAIWQFFKSKGGEYY